MPGANGNTPVDLEGPQQLLHRLSRMAADLPRLAEADFNPVLVTPDGVSVPDARIRLLPAAPRTLTCDDCAEEEPPCDTTRSAP
ncbi:acetate--CoA ligase family protein [Streptomyces sp. ID05-04B]|nr:acetate--CoA ligase family protein [Streptomyces sp. ID05-04B]